MQNPVQILHYLRKMLQLKLDFAAVGTECAAGDAGGFEHTLRGNVGFGAVVFVTIIDDFGDAGLDQSLGAFVAGEKGRINTGTFHVRSGIIQNGVQLGMAYIVVLGLKLIAFTLPGILIVGAALRHAVITDREDAVVGAYDAGTDARVRILAPVSGE